jgi:hypothetical protein
MVGEGTMLDKPRVGSTSPGYHSIQLDKVLVVPAIKKKKPISVRKFTTYQALV